MGWLWSSSTSQSTPHPSKPENDSTPTFHGDSPVSNPFPSDPPRQDPMTLSEPSFPVTDPTTNTEQSAPRTRDQIANEEALKFFRNLQIERERAAEREAAAAALEEDDEEDEEDEEPPELITPARLYNKRARCVELLDTAWFCASPGGQFFNVYRYGTFRQCGQLWADMTWCMRTNRSFMSEKEREQRTLRRAWERERDRLRERGGCSEEIWGEGRRWVEKNAFKADWEGENSPWRKGNED